MDPWDVDATRHAIERRFGRSQLELARPCLRSLSDRQIYAKFHFNRAKQSLSRYARMHLQSKDFVQIAMGIDETEWNRFNVVIRSLGADLTACVQSIHSLPDILASAVYYSLCLDRQFAPRQGAYVNHAFVTAGLANIANLQLIHTQLRAAVAGAAYKHVAALANQSKHYSIVFPSLNADLTGSREERYMLVFPEFSARGRTYPQAFVYDLLRPVHEQLSRCIVQTGHALNAIL